MFSYKLSIIAYGSQQPTIVWSKNLRDDITSVSWSPDSQKIAVALSSGHIIVFDSTTGRISWEKKLPWHVSGISWSPKGSYIAVGGEYFAIFSSKGTLYCELKNINVLDLAWSPNGEFVGIASGSSAYVYLVDRKCNIIANVRISSPQTDGIAWDKSSEHMFVGTGDGRIFLFYISNDKLKKYKLFSEPGYDIDVLSYSTNDLLAAGGDFGVKVYNKFGHSLLEFNTGSQSWGLAWSPDGKILAIGLTSGRLILLNIALKKVIWEGLLSAGIHCSAWSPKGNKLAIGLINGKIIVFDVSRVIGLESSSSKTKGYVVFGVSGPLVAGVETCFNASVSGVPGIVKYVWSFGDGSGAETRGPRVCHVYRGVGEYRVSLTVVGSDGTRLTASKTIRLRHSFGDLVDDVRIVLEELRGDVVDDIGSASRYFGLVYGVYVAKATMNTIRVVEERGSSSGVGGQLGAYDVLEMVDKDLGRVDALLDNTRMLSELSGLGLVAEVSGRVQSVLGGARLVADVLGLFKKEDIKDAVKGTVVDALKSSLLTEAQRGLVLTIGGQVSPFIKDLMISRLSRQGYFDSFSLSSDDIARLREIVTSMTPEEYNELLIILDTLKSRIQDNWFPLYDAATGRWIAPMDTYVEYTRTTLDLWAFAEHQADLFSATSGLILKTSKFPAVSATWFLVYLATNWYREAYSDFYMASAASLYRAASDLSARLRVFRELASFVKNPAPGSLSTLWDYMSSCGRGIPSSMTVEVGQVGGCGPVCNGVKGVMVESGNPYYPYVDTELDTIGLWFVRIDGRDIRSGTFYGAPFLCIVNGKASDWSKRIEDIGTKEVLALLVLKSVRVNAIKPRIDIEYMYEPPLSLNIVVKNNGHKSIYVCGLEDTPLLSSLAIIFGPKPRQYRCATLGPGTSITLLQGVSLDSPILVMAGGYPLLVTAAAGIDAAAKGVTGAVNVFTNWVGSIIRLNDPQHKLFINIRDEDGNVLGYMNGVFKKNIPGSLYIDLLNGTILVYLPKNIAEYRVIVDASYAEKRVEEYTLQISTHSRNGELSNIMIKSNITKGEAQIGEVKTEPKGSLLFKPISMKITKIEKHGAAKVLNIANKTTSVKTGKQTSATPSSTTKTRQGMTSKVLSTEIIIIGLVLVLIIAIALLRLRKT